MKDHKANQLLHIMQVVRHQKSKVAKSCHSWRHTGEVNEITVASGKIAKHVGGVFLGEVGNLFWIWASPKFQVERILLIPDSEDTRIVMVSIILHTKWTKNSFGKSELDQSKIGNVFTCHPAPPFCDVQKSQVFVLVGLNSVRPFWRSYS